MNTYEKARAIAAGILSRSLLHTEEVHHVDENPYNNKHENLVICPTREYHQLLHIRMRALADCGDANKRKCGECKDYALPEDMLVERVCATEVKNTLRYFHKACRRERNRRKKAMANMRKVS